MNARRFVCWVALVLLLTGACTPSSPDARSPSTATTLVTGSAEGASESTDPVDASAPTAATAAATQPSGTAEDGSSGIDFTDEHRAAIGALDLFPVAATQATEAPPRPRLEFTDVGTVEVIGATDQGLAADDGLDLTVALDSCRWVAPGIYRIGGTVQGFSAPEPVEIVVGFVDIGPELDGFGDDVASFSLLELRVFGNGPFEVQVDGRDSGFLPGSRRVCSLAHDFDDLDDGLDEVLAEVSSAPLVWDAPAGSIDELGVGATMRFDDPRLGYAAYAWQPRWYPFERLLVLPPDLDGILVRGIRGDATSAGCQIAELDLDVAGSDLGGAVTHMRNCPDTVRATANITGDTETLPGFKLWRDGVGVGVAGFDGDVFLRIRAPNADVMVQILEALEYRTNLRVLERS